MSTSQPLPRKMMVACTNANGERDLFVTTILASDDEVADGLHYERAEDAAAEDGYEGPFVAFDEHDQRNITRQVPELDGPITMGLKDPATPNGDPLPVHVFLGGSELHVKVKGFNQCQRPSDGGVVATLEQYDGELQMVSYTDINSDDPTHTLRFSDAANDRLGKSPDEAKPLGLAQALEALEDDEDNVLWEVEVGLFDMDDDPNTPVETRMVMAGAETADAANDIAVEFAERQIPVVTDYAFSVIASAEQVDPDDYR